MTIVNFAMTPERALMAADTLVYGSDLGLRRHPDGTPLERTKLLPLPHARIVIGFVGDVWMAEVVYAESSRLVNIDTAVDHIAQLLRKVVASGQLTLNDRGGWVQIVGWSPKHGRMISASLCSQLGFQPFQITGAERWAEARPPALGLYPDERGVAALPFPDTHDRMTAVALAQREDYPDIIGGRLLFAEVTEHEIRLSDGLSLGLPAIEDACTSGEIGANAATDTVNSTQQTDAWTLSNANTLPQFRDVLSASFSNTSGVAVVMEITGAATHVCIAGAGASGLYPASNVQYRVNGGSWQTLVASNPPGIGAGQHAHWVTTVAQNLLLPAGALLETKMTLLASVVGFGNFGSSSTIDSFGLSLRLTAIKR